MTLVISYKTCLCSFYVKLCVIQLINTMNQFYVIRVIYAFLRCQKCRNVLEIGVENNRVTEPNFCQRCNVADVFSVIHNRCKFRDRRIAILQELPAESTMAIPTKLKLDLTREHTCIIQGEMITCTGIYRGQLKRESKASGQK